jgi:hypothetical protein
MVLREICVVVLLSHLELTAHGLLIRASVSDFQPSFATSDTFPRLQVVASSA